MNFNKIIENNRNNVKNIIRLITKEENEDLEQEVFIKAWEKHPNYTEKGSFKSWINTIAKNLSKDYLKSSKFKIQSKAINDELTINSIKDNKNTLEQQLIIKQRQIRTTKAINSLKPKYKEVIIMYEIKNYSYEEISKKINCPIGTVKSRIYNAKKELYTLLENLI